MGVGVLLEGNDNASLSFTTQIASYIVNICKLSHIHINTSLNTVKGNSYSLSIIYHYRARINTPMQYVIVNYNCLSGKEFCGFVYFHHSKQQGYLMSVAYSNLLGCNKCDHCRQILCYTDKAWITIALITDTFPTAITVTIKLSPTSSMTSVLSRLP